MVVILSEWWSVTDHCGHIPVASRAETNTNNREHSILLVLLIWCPILITQYCGELLHRK